MDVAGNRTFGCDEYVWREKDAKFYEKNLKPSGLDQSCFGLMLQ